MTKLELFRMLGESYAKTHQFHAAIYRADEYFKLIATEMYPLNPHRHEWAVSNMQMFFTQESERILIMKKLQNISLGDDVVAEIKRRQAIDARHAIKS